MITNFGSYSRCCHHHLVIITEKPRVGSSFRWSRYAFFFLSSSSSETPHLFQLTCSSLIWKTHVKDSFEQQTLLILDGAQIDCVLLLFNNIVFIDRVVIFGSQSSQISSPKTSQKSSLLTNPKWYIFLFIYEDIPLTKEFRCTSILAYVNFSLRT